MDRLAARHAVRISRLECRSLIGQGSVEGRQALLAKPQTFMNLSGQAVNGLLEKYGLKPDKLLLIYDELALPWGHIRIRTNGSAGGHNGVKDVIRCAGSDGFTRLRLGIHPGHEVRDASRFVLAPMRGGQRQELDSVLDTACQAAETIIAQGAEKAMAAYNRRAPGTTSEEE